MAGESNIEWTDATWNPIVGCSIVSPGCTNCYAMRTAARMNVNPATPHYHGTVQSSKAGPVWTGKLALASDDTLTAPLRWRKPRRIFVNSMGDLFHESIPDEWIDRVFAVMALAPQHTFQVLTKRAERMRAYIDAGRLPMGEPRRFVAIEDSERQRRNDSYYRLPLQVWPLPNVWLGVSAERQQEADERIPHLLNTPAAIRFVSAEPLLGSIDFTRICLLPKKPGSIRAGIHINALAGRYCESGLVYTGDWDITGPPPPDSERKRLDQIIVGGESGKNARPMHPQWPRDIRDPCEAAGVAFFFKQWGEYLPVGQSLPGCGKVHGASAVKPGRMKLHYGGTPQQAPKHLFSERGVEFVSTADGRLTFRLGKKIAGRLLDGKEHNAFPNPRPSSPSVNDTQPVCPVFEGGNEGGRGNNAR